jgi:type IX secretion system PorP/SprF family membrane protein
MSTNKPILSALAGGLLTLSAMAQQDPMYTMYMWNTMAVNPGYAGSAGMMTVSALARQQWTGLQGAPSTQTFVVHTPLKDPSMGIGMSIVNDKIGPVHNTGMYADFAYRIKTTKRARLAFGLKAGADLYQADLTGVENRNVDDPSFSQNVTGKIRPNFGFGLYYWSKMGYVGLSTPKLLQNDLVSGNSDIDKLLYGRVKRHYFLIAGYVFKVNRDIKFKPSMMLKAVEGAPLSTDITASFLFVEKFWVGAAYRYWDGFSAILSMQITDQLRAGYAYDLTTTSLGAYTGGSHEFMVNYDLFFNKEKLRSPRYF